VSETDFPELPEVPSQGINESEFPPIDLAKDFFDASSKSTLEWLEITRGMVPEVVLDVKIH
jgi:hypothetical protein